MPVAQFTFRLDSDGTVTNDSAGVARFDNVAVGIHTITETLPQGWTQTSVVPVGGIVFVPAGTQCAVVRFRNQQIPPPPPPPSGCIDVIKETFNAQGQPITPVAQFTFRLDSDGTVMNDSTGRARFSNVTPGAHTVSENIPEGWTMLSVTPANGQVNVPSGGACATVIFKNKQVTPPPPPNGCIDVHKETFDTQGNPLTPVAQFTFRLDNDGTISNDSSGFARFTNVTPGSHTVTESVPSGWTQLSVSPAGGTVTVTGGGQCSSITFRNRQVVPQIPICTLSANPTSLPSGGSTTLTWTSQNAVSAMLDNGIGNVGQNGSYTVNNITSNRTFTLTVTGTNGQTVTCLAPVTVPPPPPPGGCIDVIKETFNSQGQAITPVAQFTFRLDSDGTVTNDSSGHARFTNVSVGSHTVTETLPSGWTQISVTPSGGAVNVPSGAQCATVVFKNQQQTIPDIPNTGGGGIVNNNNNNNTNTNTNTNTVNPVFNITIPPQNYYMPMMPAFPQFMQQQQQQIIQQPPQQYIQPIPQPYVQQQQYIQPIPQPYSQSVPLSKIPYTGFDFGPIGNSLYWLAMVALAGASSYLLLYYFGGQVTNFHRRQAMLWQQLLDKVA